MFLKLNAYAIVYTSNLHSTCILLQTALQAHSYIHTANSVTTYKPSLLLQTALQAHSNMYCEQCYNLQALSPTANSVTSPL